MVIKVRYDKIAQMVVIHESNRSNIWLDIEETKQLIRDLTSVLKTEVYCRFCDGVGFDPPSGEMCQNCGGTGRQNPMTKPPTR